MREYAAYNEMTDEIEDFEYMTQGTADIFNAEFRKTHSNLRWINDSQTWEDAK
jgi:hypothetical protein